MPNAFLPQLGHYEELIAYKKAECIYDVTYFFVNHYLSRGDRTVDQMLQAARSGKQNIVEGSAAATASRETEIKLYNVAKASLQELLADYADYLRVRNLELWHKESPKAVQTRRVCREHPDSAFYRERMDVRIARKYGVTMCSGDTIGPGGVFRTLRELPEVLRIARDIRELASDAWMINFVNPTAALGLGLMRHAPDVKSFALCDDLHDPYKRAEYLFRCGITEKPDLPITPEHDAKFDLQILGVNHCNFVVKCDYDGVSRMPQLREWVAAQAAKELEVPPRRADSKQHYNYNYPLQLFDLYGACPNALGHVKEYVPFFQGFGVSPADPEPIVPFDAFRRADEMAAQWRETEAFADGNLPMADFFARGKGDHATDIIESMWGGLGKRFYVNTANRGAVSNMASDAFLELRSDLDMNGPRPLPAVPLPYGVLGLTRQVLDTHELTVEAAVSCDRKILYRALASDPIINNLGDAKRIMEELLEAERDHLPAAWFR